MGAFAMDTARYANPILVNRPVKLSIRFDGFAIAGAAGRYKAEQEIRRSIS